MQLLTTIQSTQLLGALVILTGISPEVACTMVSMPVYAEELNCAADLRGGIELGRQSFRGRGGFPPKRLAAAAPKR
ncbi:MAG: hypothetical protein HY678_01600 [Chloroflexi bacterium]|nr:hypothetical protein [Chloroflexota bacterium]